jgi:hypothetical protein
MFHVVLRISQTSFQRTPLVRNFIEITVIADRMAILSSRIACPIFQVTPNIIIVRVQFQRGWHHENPSSNSAGTSSTGLFYRIFTKRITALLICGPAQSYLNQAEVTGIAYLPGKGKIHYSADWGRHETWLCHWWARHSLTQPLLQISLVGARWQ